MRIVIDAFGGDNAPKSNVLGAALAYEKFGVDITLTGDEKAINKIISENSLDLGPNFKIVDTKEVFDMHEEPTSILKENINSSL